MWWLEETIPDFNGFNMSTLNVDEAWLNISSSVEMPLWIYVVSEDCRTCSFKKFMDQPIIRNFSYKAIVNTQYGLTFRLRTSGEFNYTPSINDSYRICDVQSNMGEYGVYSIFLENNDEENIQCTFTNDLAPVNTYLPILVTFAFWMLTGVILNYTKKNWTTILSLLEKLCIRRLTVLSSNQHNHEDETPIANETPRENHEPVPDTNEGSVHKRPGRRRKRIESGKPNRTTIREEGEADTVSLSSSLPCSSTHQTGQADRNPKKERLKSLDAFRGLCIIIMIFADDGGGGYYFFQHCTWDGLYFADLAFPWFVWICGVGIPFAMQSRILSGIPKVTIFKEVALRSVKLILLGIMVNTSTRATAVQLEHLRIPGVLQRFGVCYLIASAVFIICSKFQIRNSFHGSNSEPGYLSWRNNFKDLKVLPWCIVAFCIVLHTAIIFFLPVPDCPRGYLGPAGLHNSSAAPPECVGGAAGYVDRKIFGTNHIHNRPTSKRVYGSGAFDPEGTLGLLTSILHIWLGVQAGLIMLTYRNTKSRLIRMLSWGIICGFLGSILCGGISNSGWIPVNKNLWSLSFVLITSSAAFILITILYLMIDERHQWSGSPLVETGRNSILLYLGHEVCHAMLPWHYSYGSMASHTSKLMEACWGSFLWIIIAVYLHDQQLFFVV